MKWGVPQQEGGQGEPSGVHRDAVVVRREEGQPEPLGQRSERGQAGAATHPAVPRSHLRSRWAPGGGGNRHLRHDRWPVCALFLRIIMSAVFLE